MQAAESGDWKTVVVTAVVDTAANAANDVVGGLLTFASVVAGRRPNRQAGRIHRVQTMDKSAQATDYKIYFFDANPSASTYATNGAMSIHDNDIGKLLGVVPLATAIAGTASVGRSSAPDWVGLPFVLPSGRDLYAIMTCDGTPTYAVASDLSIGITVQQL